MSLFDFIESLYFFPDIDQLNSPNFSGFHKIPYITVYPTRHRTAEGERVLNAMKRDAEDVEYFEVN